MSVELATRLIDVLGGLLLFTMLLILAAGQVFRAIYAVAAQAVFLGIAGAVLAAATGSVDLWIIAGITIGAKAIFLPWLLIRVVRRVHISREIEPVIPARSRKRVFSFNSAAERQSMTATTLVPTAAGP